MWLYLAILGYISLAVVGILDKFILSTEKVKPIVLVFYSTVFAAPILLAIPFGVRLLENTAWPLALIAGLSFSVALYTMYKGYEKSEVSHVGPLLGAAIPFFVLLLSSFFLEEKITQRQLAAIALLIAGCLVISFERSKLHSGWHRGMAWGLAAGIFFSFFHVISKYIYIQVGFFSGFVWIWGAMGLTGLALLISPTARQYIFGTDHQPLKKSPTKPTAPHKVALIITNKFLGVVGVVLIQFAISQGSVSLVNALHGLQYGVLIVLVAVLSKFFPKVFHEDYAPGEIFQEGIAVALIAIGLGLLLT